MNILQTAASALMLFVSFTLGALGLLHFQHHASAPPPRGSSTSSIGTITSETQADINRQGYFPLADNISANSTIPCDSNPTHISCRKTSQHVYGDGYLIVGADPATFRVLGVVGNYGEDKSSVYWIIEGEEGPEPHAVIDADPKSFKVLPGEMYAKDANSVYWSGYTVPGADTVSFTSAPCAPDECTVDAQDKHYKYLTGVMVR
jgi:DKNYY family